MKTLPKAKTLLSRFHFPCHALKEDDLLASLLMGKKLKIEIFYLEMGLYQYSDSEHTQILGKFGFRLYEHLEPPDFALKLWAG